MSDSTKILYSYPVEWFDQVYRQWIERRRKVRTLRRTDVATTSYEILMCGTSLYMATVNSLLQCYSVLSDILVKDELCIPLERESNVLSTGEGLICLSPFSKLKIAVFFCSIYKKTISFSAIVF